MDREEGRRHKQEDKHMDRYTGQRVQALPHKAPESNPSQENRRGRKEKSEREKTETESATDKRQIEALIYSSSESEGIRATESSTEEKYTGDKLSRYYVK